MLEPKIVQKVNFLLCNSSVNKLFALSYVKYGCSLSHSCGVFSFGFPYLVSFPARISFFFSEAYKMSLFQSLYVVSPNNIHTIGRLQTIGILFSGYLFWTQWAQYLCSKTPFTWITISFHNDPFYLCHSTMVTHGHCGGGH